MEAEIRYHLIWGGVIALFIVAFFGTIAISVTHITGEHKATVTECLAKGRPALECKQLR